MKKKNILVLYDNRDLDRQVLRPVDYSTFEQEWIRQNGGNSGNKLFNTAVEQYLTKEDIDYAYYNGSESVDEINEKYDMAIFTTANIFNAHPRIRKELDDFAGMIGKFKIPVYILGCGLQCAGYDDISSLAEEIGDSARAFLKSIYQTGGELAVRGYATKEFLDKVMPNTAVVTGCPSFYQGGSGLRISNEKVKEEDFRPAINGNLKYLKQIGMLQEFDRYPNSVYMDQDEFARILHFKKAGRAALPIELIRKKTLTGMKLLAEGRVQLIYDIPVWISYLQEEHFTFSCGSRIHGNIAATLAGVPSKVFYRDARTRELAEFFELPCAAGYDRNKTLYEVYCETDYTAFNTHFAEKFHNFENFMTSHGISHDLDDRSLWEEKRKQYQWKLEEPVGQENLKRISRKWERYGAIYEKMYHCFCQ